ncbi:hypothetical protein D3C77_682640 [compost metagenome]
MRSISQVIDHHQFSIVRLKGLLPVNVQRIVINNQPIGLAFRENRSTSCGVFGLTGTEPVTMGRRLLVTLRRASSHPRP